MRSLPLVSAALAIRAFASPVEKRRVVTKVAVQVKTITVYVTAGAPLPITTPAATNTRYVWWWPKPSSSARPSTAPSATPHPPTVTPAPTSSLTAAPQPEPKPSSAAPSQVSSPAPKGDGGLRPTGESQAYLSSGPEYKAAVLYHHNAARARHGAPPLTWNDACEAGARRTAETCVFEHPAFLGELKQGQNIFTVSGNAFNVTAAITESWYKGELDAMRPYFGSTDIPDTVFHSVGHLTAMLWKSTTGVGCVSIDCGDRMKLSDGTPTRMNKFTVCNYAPPGNYAGRYAENVAAPISNGNLGSWAE
ncbi:PR-1-like protein [Westerdykella ornata]|uniref:PR-1-like protein n=1 Tax=Westerdykella ornata TaxID=318751 RepID=A0A6A6JWE0_WESOR|nr:PR-1-like protein [Westerdykella ornata]KAF2280403.1 PR-1-like protein [Westerdykella ornata]